MTRIITVRAISQHDLSWDNPFELKIYKRSKQEWRAAPYKYRKIYSASNKSKPPSKPENEDCSPSSHSPSGPDRSWLLWRPSIRWSCTTVRMPVPVDDAERRTSSHRVEFVAATVCRCGSCPIFNWRERTDEEQATLVTHLTSDISLNVHIKQYLFFCICLCLVQYTKQL